MKSLKQVINEKLKLSDIKPYNYYPKSRKELRDIVKKLVHEQSMEDVINLNSIDTSKITDMSYIFAGWEGLLKIDISGWDISNVKNMRGMFNSCVNLEKIIGIENWDVSNVTDMSNMFQECESFNQDLSNWEISQDVIDNNNVYYMFKDCNISQKYLPRCLQYKYRLKSCKI